MNKGELLIILISFLFSSNAFAQMMQLDCKRQDSGISSYAAYGDDDFKRRCDDAYDEIDKRIWCEAHRERLGEAREKRKSCGGKDFVERRNIIFNKDDLSSGVFNAEEQVEYCWGEKFVSTPEILVTPTTWKWDRYTQLDRKTLTLKLSIPERTLQCALKEYQESTDLKI